MSEFVGFQFHLVVNSVNLSARVTNMTSNREQEIKEWLASNVGGTTASRRRLPSVQDLKLSVTFKDDFAASGAGSVHNTLEALMGNGGFPVEWAFSGATAATTNPVYSMTTIFGGFPTGGAVGEVMETQVEFMLSTGSVTVDTTP
jgi:hypothetical protein